MSYLKVLYGVMRSKLLCFPSLIVAPRASISVMPIPLRKHCKRTHSFHMDRNIKSMSKFETESHFNIKTKHQTNGSGSGSGSGRLETLNFQVKTCVNVEIKLLDMLVKLQKY